MNGLQENQKLLFAKNVNPLIGTKKECTRCKQKKLINEFPERGKGSGKINRMCRKCLSEISKQWGKNNPEKRKEIEKKYKSTHKEKVKKRLDKWRSLRRDRIREIGRKVNKKRNSTVKGKMINAFRVNIWKSLKGNKSGRKWEELVGFSVDQLKKHIEKQFKEGMTWENYGRYGWHIDHIIPISAFNFKTADDIDFKKCWDLKNLRPLWWRENICKKDKLIQNFQPSFSFN
jgi:hypothetical protein